MPRIAMLDTSGGAAGPRPAESLLAPVAGPPAPERTAGAAGPARSFLHGMRRAMATAAAPLDAAAQQTAIARSLAGDPDRLMAPDLADTLARALEPVEGAVLEAATTGIGGGSAPDADALSAIRRRIAGQRAAIGAALEAEAARRYRSEALPAVLARVQAVVGDDPRRLAEAIGLGREAAEPFIPLLGADVVEAQLRTAGAEAARSTAEAALRRGDFAGVEALLTDEAGWLDAATRTDLARRLAAERAGEGAALGEEIARIATDLAAGQGDHAGRIEALRDRAAAPDDAPLARGLRRIDALSQARRLDPAARRALLDDLMASGADDPDRRFLAAALAADRRRAERDPLEAARLAGAVTAAPFSLEDAATVGRGPALRREAFVARGATGGALRFTTDRQRDAIADAFERADPGGRLRQLDVLAQTFGAFAPAVLDELAAEAPVMAVAGALRLAGRERAGRQLVEGAARLQGDPSLLRSARGEMRRLASRSPAGAGRPEEAALAAEVVMAAYAAEAARTGDLQSDAIDPALAVRALRRLTASPAGTADDPGVELAPADPSPAPAGPTAGPDGTPPALLHRLAIVFGALIADFQRRMRVPDAPRRAGGGGIRG